MRAVLIFFIKRKIGFDHILKCYPHSLSVINISIKCWIIENEFYALDLWSWILYEKNKKAITVFIW